MKKLLTLTFSLLSTTAFAASDVSPEQPLDGKPGIILRVMDFSGKAPRIVKGTTLSIRKKHQLCWTSVNVPVSNKVRIAEAFYAPAPMEFVSPGMSIRTSDNKQEFLLVGDVSSVNNEYVNRCWVFDKKDPLGKYEMEIQVNDLVFKGLSFNIVK